MIKLKVETVCRFCDHECPVTVELDENQRPVKLVHERIREGFFCPGGVNALDFLHNPDRLKTPMIAHWENGEKCWRPASWEEALSLAACKLQESMERHGPESVVAVSGFNKPTHRAAYQRFCNVTGIINRVGSGNMCHWVQRMSAVHTFGTALKPNVTQATRTIVLWGLNPANTMRWDSRTLLDAVEGGARLVLVDPIPGIYAEKAEAWLPLIPGTDLALLLGLIHVILEEGWYDQEFVSAHTQGLEEVRAAAAAYSPERTGELCGLAPEKIRRAAQLIAQEGPTAFFYGNALHHNHDCYQKCRAMAILIALTGNVDKAGAMLAPVPPSPRSRVAGTSLHGEEAFPAEWKQRRLNWDKYTLKEFSMVGGQEAVAAIEQGIIRAGYVHAGDPVLQWADSKATARALGKLDFLAVSDFLMTPTAMQADVVFPAATYLEYESIAIDEQENLRYTPRICDQYDVLPDFEILRRLAEHMGKGSAFWASQQAYWDAIAQPYGLTLEEVKRQGYVRTPYQPEKPSVRGYREKGFPTPSGKIQLVLPQKEGGPAPVPCYEPLQPGGEAYPMHCTTYKPGAFFGGAGQLTKAQRAMQPQPVCYLSADVARRYSICDGDEIRIVTPTGSCIQTARVVERMAADTIALANAYWYPKAEHWEGQLCACANNLSSMEQNTSTDLPAFATRGIPCRIEKI